MSPMEQGVWIPQIRKNEDSMYFLDQEMSILFEHVDGKLKNYSGSW